MPDNESLSRRKFLTATGGAATAAAVAGCGEEDPDDGTPVDDGTDDGTDETPTPTEGEPDSYAQKAQDAWERIEDNPAPEDEDLRTEAYIEMEEAVRDDMVLLPLYHRLTERFSYEWVDIPKTGALGSHRQKLNTVELDTDHEHKSENVHTRINSTMSSLDPIQSTDTASAIVIRQVYEGLTQYPDGVAELENDLAEEVELSDDLLTYTVTIKEGVEYHEGGELTASDFVYAWRRLAESEESERSNFILGSGFLSIEHETETVENDEGEEEEQLVADSIAVEAVDDYTLEFTLSSPEPAALDIIAYDSFSAVPEGYVDDIEGYDGEVSHDEFSTDRMNGTGPFEYDTWEPDSEARVTRYDNYWGETASVDAVHWNIMEDDDAIWTYVNERNADVFAIPTQFYEPENVDASEDDRGRRDGTYGPLDNDDEVNYLGIPELTTFYVAWNVPQSDRAVRRAIAYLTDHEELIDIVFKQRGQAAYTFTPPGMWPTGSDGYNEYIDEWQYSPNETDRESAAQVLEEAGFTEDDPAEMTLTTYESEVFQEFGRLTRDKTAGLGIELELEEAPFGTLISRGQDGDLEFYSLGWIWSWVDPAYGLYGFEPEATNTSNMPGEANGYYLDWQTELE